MRARRLAVVLAPLLVAALASACSRGEPTPPAVPGGTDPTTSTVSSAIWPPVIGIEELWTGFAGPVQLTHANDDSGRLFVVELGGTIRVIENGVVLDAPFLDISDRVSTGGERGLLGMAFAPDYAETGRFYVDYTDLDGATVVSRMRVTADRNVADPETETVLLRIEQPYANHNGGQVAFGPDEMLYIGLGDGGGAGDPADNGQDLGTLLGTILRIDVSSAATYTVPPDNPFVTTAGARPEIWAWGLRNPWRFSFDVATGDLYIADVGQGEWEEIDVEPAGAGGRNYGWNLYEGSHPYPPDSEPSPAEGLTMPVVEYDHSAGTSVTGGFVYRGALWPDLDGVYFYGDYGSGRLWALAYLDGRWRNELAAETGMALAGFGQDEQGTIYLLDVETGVVKRIVSAR